MPLICTCMTGSSLPIFFVIYSRCLLLYRILLFICLLYHFLAHGACTHTYCSDYEACFVTIQESGAYCVYEVFSYQLKQYPLLLLILDIRNDLCLLSKEIPYHIICLYLYLQFTFIGGKLHHL